MNKENFLDSIFEKNIAALTQRNPASALILKNAGAAGSADESFYQFRESRSGEMVPILAAAGGRPLHSLVDPRKEAARLMESAGKSGFIILLGLGGIFHCEEALKKKETECLFAIEYNAKHLASLLRGIDYSKVFLDPRFHLLIDSPPRETEELFLSLYKPALHGGFKTIPLRSRIAAFDGGNFTKAAEIIERAVGKITADYSVQAYFGAKWFSNILRNLEKAEQNTIQLPSIKKAAVCGAGPSLDSQIPEIKKKRKDFFLIATDTSFPSLLAASIKPDAVISIDCQHISYYHFMEALPDGVILFLDLASPPLIASRSGTLSFFSGGHPLCRYVSNNWKKFPAVDTSGGNVTYAAVSLASCLGARTIELYGADFSYPNGNCYAKGSYIHGLFQNRQSRLNSLENLYSSFLFRTPLEKKQGPSSWYYENAPLRLYREFLESKNPAGNAELIQAEGLGAPISISGAVSNVEKTFFTNESPPETTRRGFLNRYMEEIKNLDRGNTEILNTLLPLAAAIRRRMKNPEPESGEILEETKNYCLKKITSLL